MKYNVHQLVVNSDNMREKLEQYINNLNGEVVSVIPNVKPTLKGMGATAQVDFLLIIEKLN